MSHLGTRLLADRFADDDEGVAAIVQEMTSVLHDHDPLPDFDVAIYDDTRDGWVARGMAPSGDLGITYPCIRLVTVGVDVESGVPMVTTDAVVVQGTLRIAAQLLLEHSDETDAMVVGMYLLRAMRGVVVRWDDPDNFASRQSCGVSLMPCQSIGQAKMEWPLGDNIVSPGALILTYPFMETVPLPTALH